MFLYSPIEATKAVPVKDVSPCVKNSDPTLQYGEVLRFSSSIISLDGAGGSPRTSFI